MGDQGGYDLREVCTALILWRPGVSTLFCLLLLCIAGVPGIQHMTIALHLSFGQRKGTP